jgi:hypothetical protein
VRGEPAEEIGPAPATRQTVWRSKTSSLSPVDFLEAAAPIAFPIANAIDSEGVPSIRWKAIRRPPSSHTLTAISIFIYCALANALAIAWLASSRVSTARSSYRLGSEAATAPGGVV